MDAIDVKGRYDKLKTVRDPYVDRAKEFASLTLPSVMPVSDDDWGGSSKMDLDWQSHGSHVTNFMVNKYMMTLLPPSTPFARLRLPDEATAALEAQYGKAPLMFFLSRSERKMFVDGFEAMNAREVLAEYITHLVVTGNAVLYMPDSAKIKDEAEKGVRFYALNQYVVRRNQTGTIIELVMVDKLDAYTMPEAAGEALSRLGIEPKFDDDKLYTLYTGFFWDAKEQKYSMQQQVEGEPIGEVGTFKKDDAPFVVGTWRLSRNEHYGRGWAEDNSGTLNAISLLSQALVEGAIAMTDIKYLVDPAGAIKPEALNGAASGAYVAGKPDAVKPVQTGKSGDMGFVSELIKHYEQKLALAALMSSAATRDAERVTAEEIRLQARELETGHAGVFTGIANTLLKRLARKLMQDIMPQLLKAKIAVTIVTGLDALGRSGDLEQLRGMMSDLQLLQAVPEPLLAAFKPKDFLMTLASMHGVDYTPWVLTDEEEQAQQQAQQQQANFSQMAAAGANGLSQMIGNIDIANTDPTKLQGLAAAGQTAMAGMTGGTTDGNA